MMDIWEEVKKLVEEKKTFHTIGRPTEFKVLKILPNGLKLEIGNQGTEIEESKKDFESVWKCMREQGYFEPMQIRDERNKFPFNRPAYIPSILSELDFIEVFKRGRRIAIRAIPDKIP